MDSGSPPRPLWSDARNRRGAGLVGVARAQIPPHVPPTHSWPPQHCSLAWHASPMLRRADARGDAIAGMVDAASHGLAAATGGRVILSASLALVASRR